jgi:hypothetical protein
MRNKPFRAFNADYLAICSNNIGQINTGKARPATNIDNALAFTNACTLPTIVH